jgi:hypothetical protein
VHAHIHTNTHAEQYANRYAYTYGNAQPLANGYRHAIAIALAYGDTHTNEDPAARLSAVVVSLGGPRG